MADQEIEAPVALRSTQPEGTENDNAVVERKIAQVKELRRTIAVFGATFLGVYGVMIISLLAANKLQDRTNYIQASAGTGCALLVLSALLCWLLTSRLRIQITCVLLMSVLASVSISLLDPAFSRALDSSSSVDFNMPTFYGNFVVITTFPGLMHYRTMTVLLVGSMSNGICFAFQLASFHSSEPLLYLFLFEIGVFVLAMQTCRPIEVTRKLRAMAVDVSISKNTTMGRRENDEVVGSELEAILNRLQKVQSNVEDALVAAHTSEELQRANESNMLIKDLLQRLTTKNIYAISPEKLPTNLSREEKVYYEENYFPPVAPIRNVRRRDRLRSRKF